MTAAPDAADAPAPQSVPVPAGASTDPAGAPDDRLHLNTVPPDATTPAAARPHLDASSHDSATAQAGSTGSVDIADRLFGPAPGHTPSEHHTGAARQPSAAPAQKRVVRVTFFGMGGINVRPLTIAMAALAAAAIVAAITVGPTAVRITQQRNATLAMPETVADLKRDDSEAAKEAANDLVTALRAEIELDQSAAAVYSDPTNDPGRSIMLFGGTTLLLSPERELDAVLRLTEDAGDRIHGLQSVDPGPLGGVMKCGSTGTDTSPMAVCGWADHGSIALALFPERSPTDAAFLMRTLRSATLTR